MLMVAPRVISPFSGTFTVYTELVFAADTKIVFPVGVVARAAK